MEEQLTWEEITKRYDKEWLELVDYEWDDREINPRAGVVRLHAKTRKEFDALMLQHPPVDSAIAFAGKPVRPEIEEQLTWEEITKRYDKEWVELVDYDWPDGARYPKAGIVTVHDTDRRRFGRQLKQRVSVISDRAWIFVGTPDRDPDTILYTSLFRLAFRAVYANCLKVKMTNQYIFPLAVVEIPHHRWPRVWVASNEENFVETISEAKNFRYLEWSMTTALRCYDERGVRVPIQSDEIPKELLALLDREGTAIEVNFNSGSLIEYYEKDTAPTAFEAAREAAQRDLSACLFLGPEEAERFVSDSNDIYTGHQCAAAQQAVSEIL